MPSTNGLSGWVALSTRLAVLLVLVSGTSAVAAESEAPGCTPAIGRVVSRQGNVEIRRAGASTWHRVERLDTQVCDGDAVRTGPRSRAALWLQPENLIRLDQRTAVTMFSNQAETRVEFFQPIAGGPVSADPDCGAAYFISRFPRNFGVRTPFLSAAIKGTEFLVAAQCSSTTLAVFEGIVAAKELQTGREFKIETLQQISVGPGLPSSIPIPIKPRDGVQWTIYYPRTAGGRTRGQETSLEQCPLGPLGVECEIGNVEALLAAGAANEAESAINLLKADGTGGADLSSIEAIVAIARNEQQKALSLARRATESEPANERAWMALSYARQSAYDLDGALEAASRAVAIAPSSSLARAREAEMFLTLGRFKDAANSAKEAEELDPHEARALQVRGFVALAELDGNSALRSFQDSLELDPSDPRTRLGLGLAKIRQRKLAEGREDIEIAVALDPTNAVSRTYLGRAYFEENRGGRDSLAHSQFGLAIALDPQDPTPWFYEGMRKQASNRPVEALDDIRNSVERNDSRQVYRPRTALDQDASTRSVAMAKLYGSLGFEDLALSKTARGLSEDPSGYAVQQYISDLYAVIPRQQLGRSSAGLQAQLRQPLGADSPLAGLSTATSFDPRAAPAFATQALGPPRPGLYDFDPLFSGPGIRLRGRGLAGDYGTAAQELSLTGVTERTALSFGFAHSQTDGQRPNSAMERTAYAALASFQPRAGVTIQAEVQQGKSDYGDLPTRFDPTFYNTDGTNSEQLTTGRLGMRVETAPGSELLATITHGEGNFQFLDPNTPFVLTSYTSFTGAETQFVRASPKVQAVLGGGYLEGTTRDFFEYPTFFFSDRGKSGDRDQSLYGYLTLGPFAGQLRAIVGASWTRMDYGSIGADAQRTHPKLGLLWTPADATTLRVAHFGHTQRLLIAGQTLEPVQVAGFGQMVIERYGTASTQTAAAIDQGIGQRVYVGAGASVREMDVPFRTMDTNGSAVIFNRWQERQSYAYFRWLPTAAWSVGLQWIAEEFERPENDPGDEQFRELNQRRVPLIIQWFGINGISASARIARLHQWGSFCVQSSSACDYLGDEKSTQVDLGLTYRFPRRFGSIGVDVLNLFDQPFLYQSVDNARFVPFSGRAIFVRVSLLF